MNRLNATSGIQTIKKKKKPIKLAEPLYEMN